MEVQDNPIKIAIFESIDELFTKDPQFMTGEDLSAIVSTLRKGRGTWLQAQALKAKTPKTKAAPLTPDQAKALLANISFDV